MTTQRLRHVKAEIRVLGVAAGRVGEDSIVVGVVYRGGLWLDGVLKARTHGADLTDALIGMVKGSPHSGQIRVIILNQDGMPPDSVVKIERLHAETNKPVIMLTPKGENAPFTWKRGGESVGFYALGLSRWTAEEVLKRASVDGPIPEALRVADMALSALLATGQT